MEASLPDGDDLGALRQVMQNLLGRVVVVLGVMRMSADAGEPLRVALRRLHRTLAGFEMVPNRHPQLDPGCLGSRQGLLPVGVKFGHLDVGVRVDQHYRILEPGGIGCTGGRNKIFPSSSSPAGTLPCDWG